MFKSILLLVDATEKSAAATATAIELAKQWKAELIAVSVVYTATLKELLTYKIMVPDEMSEYERDLELTAQRQLAHVEEQARKAKVAMTPVHKKGSIHGVVLAEQSSRKVDLIILSAFRPSLVTRDLLAREKQLILDEAACEVLIVKRRI